MSAVDVCPADPAHGPLVPRPPATPEQAWTGEWFDCATPGCRTSALLMSPELRASLAEQRDASRGWTR